MKKRGQLKISFGMIFSIILIIFFLIFTFYAIKMFLSWNDSAIEGQFLNGLQEDIDKAYSSSQGSRQETYSLPKKIEKVCFVSESIDMRGENKEIYSSLRDKIYASNKNLVFYPVDSAKSGINSIEIKHLNLEKMLETNNPLCFENEEGKVVINVRKTYGERFVELS